MLILFLLCYVLNFCRSGSVYWKGLCLANSPYVLGIWIINCIINILPYIFLFWPHHGTGGHFHFAIYSKVHCAHTSRKYLCFQSSCRMWFSWSTFSLDSFLWLSHSLWGLYRQQQVQILFLRLYTVPVLDCQLRVWEDIHYDGFNFKPIHD